MTEFEKRNQEMTTKMANDPAIKEFSKAFFNAANTFEYSYHFTWLGRPIIQYPQDIVALQELIWKVKPQLIVETGVAHGGSLILSASILEIIGGDAQVVGVDIDIRPHNRAAIEEHPMYRRIRLIEGSSIDEAIVNQVRQLAYGKGPVLVILDSNHTHEHVLRELELYSPLVGKGSYLVVMDTVVEDMPPGSFTNRPWGPGDNPKTAVREFLKTNLRFEVDEAFEAKLLLTVAPEGYLKCIAD
ncbi:MAG: hypothetical protein RIS79_1833 [Verrucomicrobiota bacterium]|jgi:cephalosporin hydroxylase